MATSRNVFISYAREDRSKIEPIVSMLRASGVNAWVDTLSIAPGANWQTEIEKGLKASDFKVYEDGVEVKPELIASFTSKCTKTELK